MNEYQIIVKFAGVVLFKTEWHVGPKEARDTAWLLALSLGERYEILVDTRTLDLKSVPWNQFGLEVAA